MSREPVEAWSIQMVKKWDQIAALPRDFAASAPEAEGWRGEFAPRTTTGDLS